MTRPTSTRAALRRAIAMRLMMPFARRIPAGYATITAVSATGNGLSDDVNLNQAKDFWAGHWAYHPTSGQVRYIVNSYTPPTGPNLRLEYGITGLAQSDTYEIHTVFNALEIHEAINQAITSSWPSFFETVEDDSIVICEDKLEYLLTGVTPSIGVVHEVALERPVSRLYATAQTDIVFSQPNRYGIPTGDSGIYTTADTDWYASIYDGVSKGWWGPIVTITADGSVTVDTSSDYVPTEGDKLLLWDPNDQQLDWYRMKYIHFDTKEWPSQLRLYSPIYAYRGSRLRIKHSTIPIALTTETATTSVPQEYIIPKACSILCGTRVGDNRVDRQRYAAMAEEFNKEAELFKKVNFFRLPDVEMWMEGRDLPDQYIQDPQGDPLNWR